jgi:phosphoribosylglycinamide formyltransferase-1
MRVVVLASGNGTTFQAFIDAFGSGARTSAYESAVNIAALICNTPEAGALVRARSAGIPTVLVDHRGRSRDEFEKSLAAVIDSHQPALICLAGFLRILSPQFVRRYPNRILNTHPSLLPAFGGKGMYGERVHEAVLAAGRTITGCTVHIVTDEPDGGPIVAQRAVPVLSGDTTARLAERVQAGERRLYCDVIRACAAGRLRLDESGALWAAPRAPAATAEAITQPA